MGQRATDQNLRVATNCPLGQVFKKFVKRLGRCPQQVFRSPRVPCSIAHPPQYVRMHTCKRATRHAPVCSVMKRHSMGPGLQTRGVYSTDPWASHRYFRRRRPQLGRLQLVCVGRYSWAGTPLWPKASDSPIVPHCARNGLRHTLRWPSSHSGWVVWMSVAFSAVVLGCHSP